jgi:hypothetical protein
MLRHHFSKLVAAGGLCAAAATLCPGQAIAGSISPSTFNASIAIGETVKVVKKIFTDPGGGLVDFLLLADNTGSMGGVIGNVQSVATQLVSDLKATYANAQFAVARYLGDPSESGETFSSAYQVIQKNTASDALTVAAIGSWFASGGGDYPEANFYALQQGVQNGATTCLGMGLTLGSTPGFCGTSGQTVGWRPSARKVVLWFGDAPSHQTTVTMDNIKTILAAKNASLVGLNNGPATTALDDTFADGGQAGNQASSVTSSLGTNGALINSFGSVPIGDIVTTVINAVGAVTNTQDISLTVLGGVPTGLGVSFDCTDPLGCNDVIGGESREITMAVTGLADGDYTFSVVAPGVEGAIEQDRIVVGDGGVSVPGPLPLLGVSAAFGWSRRLRRSIQKREPMATTT